jgi:hypothetical protein
LWQQALGATRQGEYERGGEKVTGAKRRAPDTQRLSGRQPNEPKGNGAKRPATKRERSLRGTKGEAFELKPKSIFDVLEK